MASRRRSLDEYPRPWFYRPEIYFAFIIFPPVWSVLTLRSPWHHSGDGFRNIFIGGLAWAFLIISVVFAIRWLWPGAMDWLWPDDSVGERRAMNLLIFVPGLLLTLLTQVQWAAHCARHGPPPSLADADGDASQPAPPVAGPPPRPPRKRRRPAPKSKRRGRRQRSGGAE